MRFYTLSFLALLGLSQPGCVDGKLPAAAESATLTVELIACNAAAGFIPVSADATVSTIVKAASALACPASQALLKNWLDQYVASAPAASPSDAGAEPVASAAMKSVLPTQTHPLLLTSQGYALFHRRNQIGAGTLDQAMAMHTVQGQAALDALAEGGSQ